MKNFILSFAFFFIWQNLCSQVINNTPLKTEIKLSKNEIIFQLIDLKTKGYLVHSGGPLMNNFHKLDTNFQLKWSFYGDYQPTKFNADMVVGSELTNFIYSYRVLRKINRKKVLLFEANHTGVIEFTQFDDTGKIDSFQVNISNVSLLHLNSIFLTSKNIVLLSNNENLSGFQQKSPLHGDTAILDMVLIPHDTKKPEYIKIPWDDKIDKTALEFLGNDDSYFYLLIKQPFPKESKVNNLVFKYDYNGNLVEKKNFEIKLSIAALPYQLIRNMNGQNTYNWDFENYFDKAFVTKSAYGGVKFDLESETIYFYGFENENNANQIWQDLNNGSIHPSHVFFESYNYKTENLNYRRAEKIIDKKNKIALFRPSFNYLDFKVIGKGNYALFLTTKSKSYAICFNESEDKVEIHKTSYEYPFLTFNNSFTLRSIAQLPEKYIGKEAYELGKKINPNNKSMFALGDFVKQSVVIMTHDQNSGILKLYSTYR